MTRKQRNEAKDRACSIVTLGNYLPAHDPVFDIAEKISVEVERLREYITAVRDAEQANNAVRELLVCLMETAIPTPGDVDTMRKV